MIPTPVHRRPLRRLRALVLLPAIALGVAACGSDDEDSGNDDVATTVAAATATTAAAAPTAAPATTAAAADTTAAAADTTAAAADTTAAAAGGTSVGADLSEFAITLSEPAFAPGAYTFDIVNVGEFKHNLIVEGPGVEDAKSDTFEAGQSGTLDVSLQAGSYVLYCDVPTHRGKGMELQITVA